MFPSMLHLCCMSPSEVSFFFFKIIVGDHTVIILRKKYFYQYEYPLLPVNSLQCIYFFPVAETAIYF